VGGDTARADARTFIGHQALVVETKEARVVSRLGVVRFHDFDPVHVHFVHDRAVWERLAELAIR